MLAKSIEVLEGEGVETAGELLIQGRQERKKLHLGLEDESRAAGEA